MSISSEPCNCIEPKYRGGTLRFHNAYRIKPWHQQGENEKNMFWWQFPTRVTSTRSRSSWRRGKRRLRWGSFQPACLCPQKSVFQLLVRPSHQWPLWQNWSQLLLPVVLQQTNKTQTNNPLNTRYRDWKDWVWLCPLVRSQNQLWPLMRTKEKHKARSIRASVKNHGFLEFLLKNHLVEKKWGQAKRVRSHLQQLEWNQLPPLLLHFRLHRSCNWSLRYESESALFFTWLWMKARVI